MVFYNLKKRKYVISISNTKARKPKYLLLSSDVYQGCIHNTYKVMSVQVREEQSFDTVSLPVSMQLALDGKCCDFVLSSLNCWPVKSQPSEVFKHILDLTSRNHLEDNGIQLRCEPAFRLGLGYVRA